MVSGNGNMPITEGELFNDFPANHVAVKNTEFDVMKKELKIM